MKLIGIEKVSDIKRIIDEVENITITSHVDADGDAIGSVLAVYNYLKEYFSSQNVYKEIQVVLKDLPPKFSILKGFNEIKSDVSSNIDLLVVVDLLERNRLR